MSIPSLFRTRSQSIVKAATGGRRPRIKPSGKLAALALLTGGLLRHRKTGASYLNTGHLNDHVRRDIGLERKDFNLPE